MVLLLFLSKLAGVSLAGGISEISPSSCISTAASAVASGSGVSSAMVVVLLFERIVILPIVGYDVLVKDVRGAFIEDWLQRDNSGSQSFVSSKTQHLEDTISKFCVFKDALPPVDGDSSREMNVSHHDPSLLFDSISLYY